MPRRGKWPGISERIIERLRALGYWNSKKSRIETYRFCREKGYMPPYVLKWLSGSQPSWENVQRLSRDLEISPVWLMFGDGNGVVAPPPPAPTRRPPRSRGRGGKAQEPLQAVPELTGNTSYRK